jgi:hypothetical protein
MVGTRANTSRQGSPRNNNSGNAQGAQDDTTTRNNENDSLDNDEVLVDGNNLDSNSQNNQANNTDNAGNNNNNNIVDAGCSNQIQIRDNNNSVAVTTQTPRINTLALILTDLRVRATAINLVVESYETLENFINEMHFYNGIRNGWFNELTTLVDSSRFYRPDRTKMMFLYDYHVRESGLPGVTNIHSALRHFTLDKFNAFQKSQIIPTATSPTIDLSTDQQESVIAASNTNGNRLNNRHAIFNTNSIQAQGERHPIGELLLETTDGIINNDPLLRDEIQQQQNICQSSQGNSNRNRNMTRSEYEDFVNSTSCDFSDSVLEDNAKLMHSRTIAGSLDNLKPHHLWRPQAATMSRDRINTAPFLASDISLNSDEASEVIVFYQSICQVAKSAQIDLLPFHYFDAAKSLWPANRNSHAIFEMNELLVLKLVKDGVINRANPALSLLFKTKVLESDNNLKAYLFLHAILMRAVDRLDADLPPTPIFGQHTTIMDFGSKLLTYYSTMAAIGGSVPAYNQSLYFLAQLRQQGILVDTFTDRLKSINKNAPLPPDLSLQELVLAISDLRQATLPTTHVINRVNTRSNSKPKTGSSVSDKPSRSNDNLIVKPFRTGDSIQCISCGTWGHTPAHCRSLAMYCAVRKYADANSDTCKTILNRWFASQDRTSQTKVIHQLRALHPEDYQDQTDDDIMELLLSDEVPDFY